MRAGRCRCAEHGRPARLHDHACNRRSPPVQAVPEEAGSHAEQEEQDGGVEQVAKESRSTRVQA